MHVDIHVIRDALARELRLIGLDDLEIDVQVLDESSESYIVSIISSSFDGQTYLDREMRARPAVVRSFNAVGLLRATYVIDPRTQDENAEVAPPNAADYLDSDLSNDEDTQNAKAAWREQRDAVLRALLASYNLEALEQNSVYLATRTLLSRERILVGFAKSVRAKTVDIDVRNALQTARQSQEVQAAYYISPLRLAAPFANQPRAPWLTSQTPSEFLHALDSSTTLAANVARDCEKNLASTSIGVRGKVIEPDVQSQLDPSVHEGFFAYVDRWIKDDGPASFLVVMAPAGHGKTTLTLEVTRRLARRYERGDDGVPVPMHVPFESVRRAIDFDALILKRFSELRAGTMGAFAELLRMRQAVLLVDGFDELADDAGLEVAENQIRSMRTLVQGGAKVLLAGRSIFTQMFAGGKTIGERVRGLLGDVRVEVVNIRPFDDSQVLEYIQTRDDLTSDQQAALVDLANASPDLQEICANPLFLRFLAGLAMDGALPTVDEVGNGVDAIIEKVCGREEVRQQLALGVEGQLSFLGWLATDIFKSGRAGLALDDVVLMAQEVVKHHGAHEIGRRSQALLSHALLTSRTSLGVGQVLFIHPFIRDVVLARAILDEIARGAPDRAVERIDAQLCTKDLPEACVRRLVAEDVSASLLNRLPMGWLTDAGRFRSQTRRNLFRLATSPARIQDMDSPRMWVRPGWATNGLIVGLDLASLAIESISFDDMKLKGCSLDAAVFADCDFRGCELVDCSIVSTVFSDCRVDLKTAIVGGVITGAELRGPSGLIAKVADGAQVVDALQEAWLEPAAANPGGDAVKKSRELVEGVLGQLAAVHEAAFKFHEISRDSIRNIGKDDRERITVDKIVVPTVVAKMCNVRLAAGSRPMVSLDKRWHPTVVRLLQHGGVSPGLREILSQIAMRAARYLG